MDKTILAILGELETFRKKKEHMNEPSDWTIRVCQAIVAKAGGYTDRNQWTDALPEEGEDE